MNKQFKTSPLGFGLMRLPTDENNEIDIAKVCQMADEFIANGGTYFDTAYFYHGGNSEIALKKAVVERHDRNTFTIADKMPSRNLQSTADLDEIFENQLEKTGAGYFDYYLLHAVSEGNIDQFDKSGAWQWALDKKKEGKIKNFGFSFHGTSPLLEKLLSLHPKVDFVQLQINYADWLNKDIESQVIYNIARSHNVPIVVMEPLKGGLLGGLSEEYTNIFSAVTKNKSAASFAIRYVLQLEGVFMLLSGMSEQYQVSDNIKTVKAFTPLSSEEMQAIEDVKQKLLSKPVIACTDCKYCVEGCPSQINIPVVFKFYNNFIMFGQPEKCKTGYDFNTRNGGTASQCIACKKCEISCPQHLPIIENLRKTAAIFDI